MRFGKSKGQSTLNSKRQRMVFPKEVIAEEPPVDPPPDPETDEAAFVAAMRALPEVHHNHQWMDGGAGGTLGSAYYANYGPGHPNYVAATNYATPVVGRLTENEAMYRLVPRGEATHVAVASGNWSNPAIWNTDTVPGAGAKVLISQTKTVTYDVESNDKIAFIRVDGIMNWATNINTKLVVEDWFVDMMGTLRIGTAANPIQADKTATIHFLGGTNIDVDRDPLLFGRGLLCEGLNEIRGAYKTPYVRCASMPMAGHSTITLDSVPTGWRVGDEVYIPQTSWRGDLWLRGPYLSPQYEHRTISASTPNTAGVVTSATITLSAPLSFDHDCQSHAGVKLTQTIGGRPTRPHLVNLTRNVIFETPGDYWETAPHQVGHLMWMHNDFVDVRNIMVKGMGRTRKDIRSFSTTGSVSRVVSYASGPNLTSAMLPQGTYKQHPLDASYARITDTTLAAGRTITAATATLEAADAGKFLLADRATSVTLTIPPSSSVAFANGTKIGIRVENTGDLILSLGSGVSLTGLTGLTYPVQGDSIMLQYQGNNVWLVQRNAEVVTVPHTYYSNVQGRYPIHLHRAGFKQEESCPVTGDTICACNMAYFENVVAWNTLGWAFAHHESNAEFNHCIAINAWGSGFVAENGAEAGVWDGCFVGGRAQTGWVESGVEKDGNDVTAIDFARNSSGFWYGGRNIRTRNCIATATKMSYTWMPRKAQGRPIVSLIAEPSIAHNTTPGATMHVELPIIHQFDNNCAYGALQFAVVVKEKADQGHALRTVWKDSYGWGLFSGIQSTYTGKYTFINSDFVAFDRARWALGSSSQGPYEYSMKAMSFDQNAVDQVAVDHKAYGFFSAVCFLNPNRNTIGQEGAAHVTVNVTAQACKYKFSYDPYTLTNNIGDREAYDYVESGAISSNWLNYETPDLVPGRLFFVSDGPSPVSTPAGQAWLGMVTDAIGTRRLEGVQDFQGQDTTIMRNHFTSLGYYTYQGTKVYLLSKIVSDRLTGNYIKFLMPATWNDFFVNLNPGPNLGPLPSQYVPQLAAGYTWTADVNAQRYAHDFSNSVEGEPIPPIIG